MNEDQIAGFFTQSLKNRRSSPKSISASIDQTTTINSSDQCQETLSLQPVQRLAYSVSRTISCYGQEQDFIMIPFDPISHIYIDVESPFS